MADLRKLKDRAAELAARGKVEKAAEILRQVLAADPKDVSSRQKLGDVLRRAGRIQEAVASYREAADRFAHDGLLVKAIALSKTILEIDPGHVETQASLADLYARRARPPPAGARPPRPHAPLVAPPAPEEDEDRPVAIPLGPATGAASGADTPFERIAEVASDALRAGVEDEDLVELEPLEEPAEEAAPKPARVEAPEPAGVPAPPALPRVPIFSDLSREAFLALTEGMVLHRLSPGDASIREGDGGASFFVVAAGRMAVSRRDDRGEEVVLARLGEGDFFGEMALLSGAPRSATVRAEGPAEVLELRADLLLALAGKHPHLADSLRRFYRQRLLANAMSLSPVFRPFPVGERKLIMSRFRSRDVEPGDVVIREGEPSDGLYVVLAGAVEVVKRRGPAEVAVGRLQEGDLFGETSCLRKSPATATVRALRRATLLRLPRSAFDELVLAYPQILELVADLSEERVESLDAILAGRARWTEEGLVLV
ncbi:MAG TPA: cyclic nucleotide-binding domain-containing protein [Anaeromyxobacteraceae bacterium]|nr:cyclic nucleotide-binding domain-containing protein [Anaeromyxobacteraceae bacterium]